MVEIREQIRKNREEEVLAQIEDIVRDLNNEGFDVEFGTIGTKTNYALIFRANSLDDTEYVGYTFIRNMKYYNENTGKLKALQQAIARKETLG